MGGYLLRRLGQLVLVAYGSLTLIFLALHLSGDPVAMMVGAQATGREMAALRHSLGLDAPLYVQYVQLVRHYALGDFGRSLRDQQPVRNLLLAHLGATAQLTAVAFAGAVALSIPMGVVAAVRRGTFLDTALMAVSFLGQSIPTFWLGIMLILAFAVRLHWLPTSGMRDLRAIVLPSCTLAAFALARLARLARTGMVEIMHQDYIRTAFGKGLPDRVVIYRHALRNGAISIVTMMGVTLSALLGGAVITETIFAWPGIGYLLIQGVYARDYPLVEATVFVIAILTAVTMLLVDVSYFFLDPRLRRYRYR